MRETFFCRRPSKTASIACPYIYIAAAAAVGAAGPITTPSMLRVGNGSLCVQVNGTNSNSVRLVLAMCTGSNSQPGNQLWVSGTDPNTKRIQTASSSGTSRCIDVSSSGTSTGSPVIVYTCQTANNQKWTQDALGRWSPGHAPTMCLDTVSSSMNAGTLFVINKCSNATSQKISVLTPGTAAARTLAGRHRRLLW